MKISSKIKTNTILILFLIFTSSIQLLGRELISKKVEYILPNNLTKTGNTDYFSKIMEIPIPNPEPFIAIGFNGELTAESILINFDIRVSEDGINWTEWFRVNEEEDGNEENKFLAALNFFDKENKYIQFRTNNIAEIKSLNFSFISPGNTPESQIRENLQKSNLIKKADVSERPGFVSRTSWGCPQSENVSSRSLTDVTHLIIHHSAGQTTASDFAAVVLSYWDYHVNSHGWADIGYNWLVDPNGVLYKGRAWKSGTEENVLGAHNSGKNGNTAGICLIGNYVSSIPSESGINKIAEISAFLCDKYGLDPLGQSYHAGIESVNDNIDGHGQSGGGTACPGTQVINRMQVIRDKTFEYKWNPEIAPEIVSTYPATEQDSAYLSKEIIIKFTHPMNQNSVENSFSILPETQGLISWNSIGNTLYFKPNELLSKMTFYKITISDSAKSLWDKTLIDNYEFNFITKASDNISLLETFPADGAAEVELDISLEIKFDGPIAGNSLGGNISFVDENSNSVGILVSNKDYERGVIKFTPTSSLKENSTYFINLKSGIATTDGHNFGQDKTISFQTISITTVENNNPLNDYQLFNAYPNPFNPVTTISYAIPVVDTKFASTTNNVSLKVYDVLGKEIKTLVEQFQSSGNYNVNFDATDLPSGIYYYRLQVGYPSASLSAAKAGSGQRFVQTKKMILMK